MSLGFSVFCLIEALGCLWKWTSSQGRRRGWKWSNDSRSSKEKRYFAFFLKLTFFSLSQRTTNLMKILLYYFVDEGSVKNASCNRFSKWSSWQWSSLLGIVALNSAASKHIQSESKWESVFSKKIPATVFLDTGSLSTCSIFSSPIGRHWSWKYEGYPWGAKEISEWAFGVAVRYVLKSSRK